MKDYSKPTGWWCRRNEGFVDAGADRPCPFCIPVYAVIPKRLRPQTTWGKSGGAEAETVTAKVAGEIVLAVRKGVVGWPTPKPRDPALNEKVLADLRAFAATAQEEAGQQ